MLTALRPGMLAVAFLASAAGVSAQSKPLSELPGFGKPQRSGYVITVDDGEGNVQTSRYNADGKTTDATSPSRPAAPVRSSLPGSPSAAQSPQADAKVHSGAKSVEVEQVDPVVSRLTGREENLSERRRDRENSPFFGKDEKYDRRDPKAFDKWARGDESVEKSVAAGVDMDRRFEGDRIDKNKLEFDRRDRETYWRSGERAEVNSWTERFSRDKSAKFSDTDRSSTLRERMNDGYKLMMQVSMQDINRVAFRRNHSEEKGGLPVSRVGTGASSPMKPASGE